MLDNRAILFTLLLTQRWDMRQTNVNKELMLDVNKSYHTWLDTNDNSKIRGYFEVESSINNFIDQHYFSEVDDE